MATLHEKYRPKTWADIVGQDEALAKIDRLRKSGGTTGRAWWIRGPSGTVRVKFELDTNTGGNLGGWNIDDFCVIGYNIPSCGNGAVEGDEECDDGNDVDSDGCNADCTLPDDDDDGGGGGDDDDDGPGANSGDLIGGCGCRTGGGGPSGAPWLLLGVVALMLRRRMG